MVAQLRAVLRSPIIYAPSLAHDSNNKSEKNEHTQVKEERIYDGPRRAGIVKSQVQHLRGR